MPKSLRVINAPTSSYDVDCSLLLENTDDFEVWSVTINFWRPEVLQLKFELPVRYAIKNWLPWNKSPLRLIPSEMMSCPLISAPFLIKKALDLGLVLPNLVKLQAKQRLVLLKKSGQYEGSGTV